MFFGISYEFSASKQQNAVLSSFEPIPKALKISFNKFYRLALPVCQQAADEEIRKQFKQKGNTKARKLNVEQLII
ncbi:MULTISPECIES: hypothetical protein [unclassified Microcoleus]|uniref:hypothetical protein n=1 Tax=unclassified Microcoleus TaxID=2642155 RepID=UPI002FD02179